MSENRKRNDTNTPSTTMPILFLVNVSFKTLIKCSIQKLKNNGIGYMT